MEKLYLIRRNLETIVGPMTIDEFRRGFEHMDFGLQDEIAGHCSRWVFLDNSRMLKRYYPSIHKLLDDHVKSWSDGLNRQALPDTVLERPLLRFAKTYSPVLLAVLLALVGLGWYFGPTVMQSFGVAADAPKEVKLSEATALYEAARFSELEAFMKANLATLMSKNQGATLEAWLPYVRWYAYRSQGELSGVPAKLLRGVASEAIAPPDCSLANWKSRFREGVGEWKALFSERSLPESDWARLLAWEPDWINRRPQVGWLKPESYYGACLYMGLLAVHELSGEDDFVKLTIDEHKEKGALYLQAIKTRLAWVSHLVNGTQKPMLQLNRKAYLSTDVWTCLEAAIDAAELNTCQNLLGKDSEDAWGLHHRYRYLMALTRLMLSGSPEGGGTPISLSREQSEALNSQTADGFDAYTNFDYRAESLFIKLLAREQNDFTKSLERARAEYPSVILNQPRDQ